MACNMRHVVGRGTRQRGEELRLLSYTTRIALCVCRLNEGRGPNPATPHPHALPAACLPACLRAQLHVLHAEEPGRTD
jgi:hypothetical protein